MDYTQIPPVPQGLLPLTPLADQTPPKKRIPNPAAAQTLVVNLWQANLQRNMQNAAIQGQIDGNPPFSPAKLRSMGRASDPNFNTLEAKALRSAALVPYYDLFAGGNRYVEVKLAPPGQGDGTKGRNGSGYNGNDRPQQDNGYASEFDPVRLSDDSGIASEEYDRLLRRWTNFEHVMYSGLTDYVTFGRCHLPWESEDSWRFRRIAYHRVMVPDATPIDYEELELVVVFQNYTVARLYGLIRDEAAARDAGWNIDETLNAIARAVPVDPAIPSDPLATQQMIRDADIYVSARSSTVQVATLYVKEFSGKWSELVVRRDQIPGTISPTDASTRDARYLFAAYDRYSSFDEILPSFFFEVTDGTWNGASGLGRDIFTLMQLKDRLACTQAQSVMLRNSLVLQPQTALDKSRMNLLQLGAVTWLPEGVNVHQSTILGDIASTIEVSRELSQMVERNTGIYRPTMDKQSGNPDTLGEFQAKFAQATVLSTAGINRFYSQLDRLYEQQWKRVLKAGLRSGGSSPYEKAAREFVHRCESRGVTRECLQRLESIKAFRNIGQGSLAMRQQMVSTFLSPNVYPLYPADGQQAILEDFTRVLGSQSAVDRYLPETARRKLPTDQLSYALLENAALRINAPVTWTPSQNNVIHSQAHLQAGAQAAASVQQGADPHDIVSFLDAVGSHVAAHLQHEQQNPTSKQAVKILTQQWKQLASINDKLKQAIMAQPQQQQQLAERRQDILTDASVKREAEQGKLAISREKAIGTLQLKKQRQDADLALKARQQQIDAALASQSLQADASIKQASAALGAQLADAETAASITRETAATVADQQREHAVASHEMSLAERQAAHDRELERKAVEASSTTD